MDWAKNRLIDNNDPVAVADPEEDSYDLMMQKKLKPFVQVQMIYFPSLLSG